MHQVPYRVFSTWRLPFKALLVFTVIVYRYFTGKKGRRFYFRKSIAQMMNSAKRQPTSHSWSYTHAAVLVGCIGMLTFINSCQGDFVWDDRAAIVYNPDVSEGSTALTQLFQHDFWGQNMSDPSSHKSYRPITVLTFRANYFWSETNPFFYHLLNILLHGINCVLVVLLSSILRLNIRATMISSLLFAVHPVHCDSVASIVGRADVLCTTFGLTAVLVYHYAIHQPQLVKSMAYVSLSFTLIALATLSKELGITLLAVMVILDFQHANHTATIVRCSSLVLGCSVFMVFRLGQHGDQLLYNWSLLENHLVHEPIGLARVLSTMYTHALYLTKLVWPQYLCYDYGFDAIPLIKSLYDIRNVHTLVAYSATLVMIVKAIRSPRSPFLVAVSLAVFTFLPATNIIFPAGTIVAERLLYLPSVGFCFVVGILIDQSWHRVQQTKLEQQALVILYGIGSILFIKCLLRNAEWQSEEALFESAVRVAPNSVKVLNNLAKTHLTPERATTAIGLLQHAIHLYPPYTVGHMNLGLAYALVGKTIHAMQHYQYALDISTDQYAIRGYIGQLFLRMFEKETMAQYLEGAASHLDFALTSPRPHPTFLVSRGFVSGYKSNLTDAMVYFDLAEEMNTKITAENVDRDRIVDMGSAYNAFATSLSDMNRMEDAMAVYLLALNKYPAAFHLLNNAAILHSSLGHYETALQLYSRAVTIAPENGIIATNAGYTAEKSGQLQLARDYYERAYSLNPTHDQIRVNLMNLQLKLK